MHSHHTTESSFLCSRRVLMRVPCGAPRCNQHPERAPDDGPPLYILCRTRKTTPSECCWHTQGDNKTRAQSQKLAHTLWYDGVVHYTSTESIFSSTASSTPHSLPLSPIYDVVYSCSKKSILFAVGQRTQTSARAAPAFRAYKRTLSPRRGARALQQQICRQRTTRKTHSYTQHPSVAAAAGNCIIFYTL